MRQGIRKLILQTALAAALLAVSPCAAYAAETPPAAAVPAAVKALAASALAGTVAEAAAEPHIDFTELRKINSDIYAWLYIPDTNISYPVLQSAGNDEYYLKHNKEGEPNGNGELFTEHVYNRKNMRDPVTVIYGHNMRTGRMFGRLQKYYSGDITKHNRIYVYLPDRRLTYEVFAAIPYENGHILASYNFANPAVYDRFFTKIQKTRVLGGTVDRSVSIKPEDKVLILSTCLAGNHTDRFIVLARLTETEYGRR